ncbi:MAG: serine/threonine-protein kinase HipA [Syntrophaceae bacterium]|nr:MAG: serine/threonine-protein kinase HipA [Syntrophaceae bacterium]
MPESLDELLVYSDTKELFHELVAKYALSSGISGVQPKVLLDASERGTLTQASYIVKSWGSDYPCLAANEYFCMTAAKRAGLSVPEFFLSHNGGLLIMRRFDITAEGAAIGFEDMCSLQALGTAKKYAGSYERVAKSISDFVSGNRLMEARQQFFSALVLSVMLRNGDAHLKNFGVLYDLPGHAVRMAPVYDLVTTTAYIAKDVPALTLAGTKKWWPKKTLERFAVAHLSLPMPVVSATFNRMAEAVTETRALIPAYMADHPGFKDIGQRLIASWDQGVKGLTASSTHTSAIV